MTATRQTSQPPLAGRGLAVVAGLTGLLLIGLSSRYGYHRDELYFLECGRHLAWGYPDQPPLVPLIARLMSDIAATSLVVFRLPSALAIAASVFLTGVIARQFGADRQAQVLAAAALAMTNFVLATGHLLSTTTFDLPVWAGVVALCLRAVRSGRQELWLAVGVLGGVGLLDSDLVAFLLIALLVGVAVCGPRDILRSPWLYAGAGIALLIWSPYLLWQGGHGWPEFTIARNIANGGSGTSAPRWEFVPYQLLLAGVWLTPLWIVGLVRLVRDPALRWCRALPCAYGVLVVVFVVTGGKPYYIAGFLPVLMAAGAEPVLSWCRRARWRRAVIPVAAVLSATGFIVVLPILPLSTLHKTPIVSLNYDAGETVGWPAYVAEIGAVYSALRPATRGNAVILASNYGEGGAVDRYGKPDGLPTAYAVQNGFWLWGPPPADTDHVVAVGFDRSQLRPLFGSLLLARRLNNHLAIDDDEQNAPVWVCSGPRESWSLIWQQLRDYG